MVDDELREWIRERVEERIDLEDLSEQYNPWTSKYHIRQDIQLGEWDREQVVDACDEMAREGVFIYWNGWITPKREDALRAVLRAEANSDVTRKALVAKCNRALQALDSDEQQPSGATSHA